jgi:hypothetical protein
MTSAVLVSLCLVAIASLLALLARLRYGSRRPPPGQRPAGGSLTTSAEAADAPPQATVDPEPVAPLRAGPVAAEAPPARALAAEAQPARALAAEAPPARALAAEAQPARSSLGIPVHVSTTPVPEKPETLRPAPAQPDTVRPPPALPDTVRPTVATAPVRETAIPKHAALPSFVPAASPKSVPPRPTPRPPGAPAYMRPRAAPSGVASDSKDAPPIAAPASRDKAAPAPTDRAASVQRQASDTATRAPKVDTAEIEKADARHQAARKFARLAVSEIVLYRKAEVLEGRKAHDLWSCLKPDIKLCVSTYEQRVPKDVRDRFDYLYDEFVRQLAEGDPAKLGPNWPRPT